MKLRSKIKPVKTFDSEAHPLNRRQFYWLDEQCMSIALYAGKEMMICLNDDNETWRMTYLDLAHPDKFTSIDQAKDQARSFATTVLVHMIKCVGIDESEKDDPLPADEGHQAFRDKKTPADNPYNDEDWRKKEWDFGWDCEEQSNPDAYNWASGTFKI